MTGLAPAVAYATSIVPPENLGELARSSQAVVLAAAGTSRVSQRGALLFTLTTFRVLDVASGGLPRNARFTVEAPGGELGGVGWAVPGAPRFATGGVYLLFLDVRPTGEWLPKTMAYGLLRQVTGRDGSTLLAPLPQDAEIQPFLRADGILPEPVGTYLESALLLHLRAVVAGRQAWNSRAVLARSDQVPMEVFVQTAPSQCAFMSGSGHNMRWKVFDTGGSATMSADDAGDGSIAGGGFSQIQGALSDWSGIPSTSLDVRYGGKMSYTMTCTSGQDNPAYGVNIVMFDDPCSDIADLSGCSGTLGFGGPWYSGTHTFDGTTWNTITSWFVVLNNGVGCLGSTDYKLMVEHELGHGLGFDHVQDSNALMYANCCNAMDSTDITCAQYLYPRAGGGPTPTPTPIITPPPTPTPPVGLVASFTFTPVKPYALQPVQFVDASSGATGWLWTFGDGQSSTQRNPAHTYGRRGTFPVTLKVTNGLATAQTTKSLTVDARARRNFPGR
jgi:PKD repeat protein